MNETMLALFSSRGLTPSESSSSPAGHKSTLAGHSSAFANCNPLSADCSLTSSSYSQTIAARTLAQVNQTLTRNGLHLSVQEVATLQEERAETLAELERIECGPGALPLIVESLASSPFVFQENLAETLACAQRLFYQIRDEIPIDVPDEELAEALRICFDQLEGDLDELEALSAQNVLAASPETAHGQSRGQNQEAARICELQREYEDKDCCWPQDANHAANRLGQEGAPVICALKQEAEPSASFSGAYRIYDENGREYVFCPASEYEDAGLFFMQDGMDGMPSAEWNYDEFADGWDGEKWGDDLD